jgi:hypothetical protein
MIRSLQNGEVAFHTGPIASISIQSKASTMSAGFSLSRGDIVMRGDLTFVVWTHGQGEIAAFPHCNGMVDCTRKVKLDQGGLAKVGRLDNFELAELKEHAADAQTRMAKQHGAGQWEVIVPDYDDPLPDGRYRAEQETGCYWVQPNRDWTT